MSFALIGVVAMQLYFLRQSYDMQSKLFDRSVNDALDNVAEKLTKQDAINFLNNKTEHNKALQKAHESQIIVISGKGPVNLAQKFINKDSALKQSHRLRKLALLRDSLKHMLMRQTMDELTSNIQMRIEEYTDEFGVIHGRLTPVFKTPSRNEVKTHRKLDKYIITHYTYQDPQLGEQLITKKEINPLWLQQQDRLQKQAQLNRVKKLLTADSVQTAQEARPNVMQTVYEEYQKSGESLKERLSPYWIDTLLRMELHNKGVNLPFSYEVSTKNTDSVIFSKAMDVTGTKPTFIPADTYQTPIFGKEVLNDPGVIKLSFPQKSSSILSKMTANLAITGGLLIVLIFCFGYTLFSIIRQKKISEMKTDFINNMTHEFKTPVSTIMIASEALKDSEVAIDRSRIARLANIIYEENERLGSHIERVLNIAKIDKNDFKLEKKPLDVNDMISIVVDSMALKLQKCNADITLELEATNSVINADELHFSNVLYNLIDNAIKYSEDQPQITISSANKNGHVIIKVADKGIGMSRDQQTKIFEQFYRIPTGNVHNVKGFGLGLSYVNTVVKRLNGTINVRSEKDKGSEFELKFQGA
jgi:two-component system phosphate regulon sensor histidine kinase PhoR